MRFPLVFELGGLRVSGHFVFELVAYLLGALLHVGFQLVFALATRGTALVLWGLTQALSLLPAIVLAYRRGERGQGRGLTICLVVSFLLWGGCVGAVMYGGVGF
jgi:hypothetical protein